MKRKPSADQRRIAELRRCKAYRLARVLELAEDGAGALEELDRLLLLAKAEGRDEAAELAPAAQRPAVEAQDAL
jgi:hypothetical protein